MMRIKITVESLVVVAILMLWAQSPSYAGELISNGGFESGASGWDQWHCKGHGAVGVVYSTSADRRPGSTGRKSLQIRTTAEFTCSNWIRQAVRGLKGGTKYRMSIWYKVVKGGGPDGPIDNFVVRDMKNDTNVDRNDLTVDLVRDGKWKYIADEFRTESSTTSDDFYRMMVNIYPRGKGGKGGIIRVDDFSLQEIGPKVAAEKQYADEVEGALSKLLRKVAGAAARKSQGVEAGIMDGFPYLRNDKVIYLWSKVKYGCGLLKVRDLVSGRDLLDKNEADALWWTINLKRKAGSKFSYDNAAPCKVSFRAAGGKGKLIFKWPRPDADVTVEAQLGTDDALLRARIGVDTKNVGLRTVTFPVVNGIKPLSQDVADDRVLYAKSSGTTKPSPVSTGKPLNMRYNISYYMQFTALLGGDRGLYFGDHDPTAAWKEFSWTPNVDAQTLGYAVAHPVLNWAGEKLVTHYESPGDCVLGPFGGDWYDAARIYRAWAVTAPWCAKGTMYERDDYPKWFLNINYWAIGHMGDYNDQDREFVKRDLFNFPITVTHDYGHFNGWTIHDTGPEYFPPKPGSQNYQRVLKELRARGARVVPYVMGWLWNSASEDYRSRGAKEKGAILAENGNMIWAELEPGEQNVAMCPATQIWRDKLTEVSVEFTQRYRTGGIYFDYFSVHLVDCFNPDHGHALGGGDYWSRGVKGLYQQVRDAVHKIDPEAIFSGENLSEPAIGILDAHWESSYSSDAPVWQVVYHDYIQLIGGMHWMEQRPLLLGRQWLYGHVYMLSGTWGYHKDDKLPQSAQWQYNMLRCHHEFARPYLGYGEMLRPPVVTGDLPSLPTTKSPYGPFTAQAVEGTAWRAPDGSVGIFFFNYEDKPHQFTWKTDVAEVAGFDASKKLQITQWTEKQGVTPLKQIKGGMVGDTMNIAPRGIVALKLEVIQ